MGGTSADRSGPTHTAAMAATPARARYGTFRVDAWGHPPVRAARQQQSADARGSRQGARPRREGGPTPGSSSAGSPSPCSTRRQNQLISEAFVSAADGTKVDFLSKTTWWIHKGKPKHDVPMTARRGRASLRPTSPLASSRSRSRAVWPARPADDQALRAGRLPSSVARTFRASSRAVNGLPRKSIPGSSTPWCTIASSV